MKLSTGSVPCPPPTHCPTSLTHTQSFALAGQWEGRSEGGEIRDRGNGTSFNETENSIWKNRIKLL